MCNFWYIIFTNVCLCLGLILIHFLKIFLGQRNNAYGDNEYSGKFNLRVPKSLHRHLSERAAAENASLNQYCLYKLSR
ncbi:toxin-antitoxin system HicB family antitoxin [Paenibacillus lentus]|uniref:Toxin-antitoxin system HicB family antitoxin n=1 Tax=Paenibacillus lentus TaxID=1338368 RepID=A0A3S8RW92_9BACL|nr:toxin-antitoxin system HicB family antitoxin [Paenibacillus lentus]AZK47286.1 toxin-antitoxin system HicB family antitoxin [Paenibacillus lentus]